MDGTNWNGRIFAVIHHKLAEEFFKDWDVLSVLKASKDAVCPAPKERSWTIRECAESCST